MQRLNSDQLMACINQLPTMLDRPYCLEYGDPERSIMSGVQITYITTAGGPQYRICRLSQLRQPTASQYTPSAAEAFKIANQYVQDYMRPNPRLQDLRVKAGLKRITDRDLYWFEAKPSDGSDLPKFEFQEKATEWLRNAETITLELPTGAGKGPIK